MKPESCAGCSLEKIGSGFTAVETGPRYATGRLLLCGEASGEHEAREGLPFRPYAQAGSLLSDAMRQVGVGRGDVAITNCIRCRPPRDFLSGAPYESNALYNCSVRHLDAAIRELQPNCILALGETAFRMLAEVPKGKYGTLPYLRGYVVQGKGVATGIPVIGTPHPAWIRRGNPQMVPLLQRDLRRAWLVAQGKLVRGVHWGYRPDDLNLNYQTQPSLEEAWEYVNKIDPEKVLAFDIETPLSTRSDEDERTSFTDRDIKLFQCTQQRGSGIALPFRDEYVEVIRSILAKSRIRVGFNNWSFDDPVLAANGIDVGPTDDAMVMMGFLWSDLPKNLQASAQLAGFPFNWKHYSESDLAFYGCADVDATLCVYEYCKREMEKR